MTAPEPHINELADYERVIRPKKGLVAVDFDELWRYRELFWFLAWRDILVRYKQAALGVAWTRPVASSATRPRTRCRRASNSRWTGMWRMWVNPCEPPTRHPAYTP
ncbi:MAG: hypothetical protein ABMA26_21085 [Limisphaerales bacterium]